MQNSRGVVAGIDAPERIGNDRLPEIALGVAFATPALTASLKLPPTKWTSWPTFAKITVIPVS